MALIGTTLLAPIANSVSTINQGDIAILKSYADAFNQSRNYITPSGPVETYCFTTGTFLAHKYCYDTPTCMQTANLVCSVSGQEGCMIDVLAAHILAYKNGLDALNAAYSSFMSGYNAFSTSNIQGSLNQMDNAFDAMKSAADEVSQSKLRLPDRIPCPCTNSSNCCLGRCPEARFNYTAIANGKAEIIKIQLKSCLDGTPGGQCSANKPSECILGQLSDNSNKCGCPSGMKAAANGRTCEFIPCIDNGVSVPEATCSPKNVWKKCEKGVLIDKPSECGCPAGQLIIGNACACPAITTQTCNIANVTVHHNVTYTFDRGMKKTVDEPYTYEKKTCYSALSTYTGTGCAQLVNSSVNGTPTFETQAPQKASTVQALCNRCPAACTRKPPNGLECGYCACPPNLGFCNTDDERVNVTAAQNITPAYCANELLLPQKNDSTACANGFECRTGECRNNACYNRQNDPLQLLIDWVQGLLGFKK